MAIRILSSENITGDLTLSGALTVNGIGTFNAPTGGVAFNVDAFTDGYGVMRFRTNNNISKWDIGLNSSNHLYIQNTGLNTALEFDTSSNATFAGQVIALSSSSGDYVRMYGASGTGRWDIYGNGENLRISENSSGGGVFAVDSGASFGGNVTFNGPSTKFNTDGDSFFEILDAGTNACYLRAGASDEIYMGANNNYQLRFKTNKDVVMDNGGNFGIGTDSPADKLEIKSGYLRMHDPSSNINAGFPVRWSSNNGGTNVTFANISGVTTSAGNRTGDLYFSTSNAGAPTEKMRITSEGYVNINNKQNSGLEYDLLINLGTSPNGKIAYQTREQFNNATLQKWYNVDAANAGTSQWVKLGTLSNFGQGGYTFCLTFFGHTGYNANNAQDYNCKLFMKTSNGGGSGARFNTWVENTGKNVASPAFKLINTDSSGTPTVGGSSFEIYMNVPAYANGSIYAINKWGGDWTSQNTIGQTDPGADSSTVLQAENVFNIFNTNVGIGTNSPTSQLYVNNTSDGDKIRWGRSDALVGSVGTYNGVPYIGYQGGAGGGIMFNGLTIEPTALGSTRSDDTNNLGSPNFRWKNVYIGDGVYLGGTGSSSVLKKFVGYQAGNGATWTPSVTSSGGGGFPTYTSSGFYQQIGNVVTVSFEFTISDLGTSSGTVIITNLPIAISQTNTVAGYGHIKALGQSLTIYHYVATNQIGINKYNGSFAGTTYKTIGTVTYWAVT